jgi:hypothetical protein
MSATEPTPIFDELLRRFPDMGTDTCSADGATGTSGHPPRAGEIARHGTATPGSTMD